MVDEGIATKIRVLSVDDHPFLAEGLRARLSLEPDIEFVGHHSTADELVNHVLESRAEIVLLDIEMPGADPFEAIARLRRAVPACRVIMLSAFVRDHYVDGTVKAGAWGYLAKSDAPAEIVRAIREVAAGRFTFGPIVLERCRQLGQAAQPMGAEMPIAGEPGRVADLATAGDGAGQEVFPPSSRLASLTAREVQVLRMIGRGLSRTDIAKAIFRSPKTVDAHRAAIMEKLRIHDRVELARFAIREGLVEL
jgi:DNA-binding NarL/FixJ family response regulator